MVTFIKWLFPFLPTALTIWICVFISRNILDAARSGGGEVTWGILGLLLIMFLLLPSLGAVGGVALWIFVISRILKEKPSPPKTPSQLICGKCNKMNPDSWQWQYCRKCGTSLKNALVFNSENSLKDIEIKPKPKDTEIKPKPKGDDEFGLF